MDSLSCTVGEMLDSVAEDNVKQMVLNVIEEIKQKKKRCDRDMISSILLSQNISEEKTRHTLSMLENEGRIVSKLYFGKVTYKLTALLDDSNNDSFISNTEDFQDFKKYTTEKLSNLENTVDSLLKIHEKSDVHANIITLTNKVECKDAIIAILREEIQQLRDQNKELVNILENKRQTQSSVSNSFYPHTDSRIKNTETNIHDEVDFISLCKTVINQRENITTRRNKINLNKENDHNHKGNDTIKSNANMQLSINESHTTTKQQIDDKLIKVCCGIENQLKEVREKYAQDYRKTKNKCTLIIGDSMLNGVQEKKISKHGKVKIAYFSGAKVEDINNEIKPMLIEQRPKNVILHVGTNNAKTESSNIILDKLLTLKNQIEKENEGTKVIISSLIKRSDDGKACLTVDNFNKHIKQLKINILDNANLNYNDLGMKGLHLSKSGKAKFAKNIINKIKELN